MRIRGYLSKERFSMKQVAGLLAVVFVGVAVFSYAGVSIPYTFTVGTTAKASEVNANFQALANAMPAVKTTYLNEATITSTTGEQITSLQVTLPASGQVIVNATGVGCVKGHVQNHWSNSWLKISKTSGDTNLDSSFRYGTMGVGIQSNEPSYTNDWVCENSFSINDVFTESSTGPITYYLNGAHGTSADASTSFKVMAVSLTALYVPNTLQ